MGTTMNNLIGGELLTFTTVSWLKCIWNPGRYQRLWTTDDTTFRIHQVSQISWGPLRLPRITAGGRVLGSVGLRDREKHV